MNLTILPTAIQINSKTILWQQVEKKRITELKVVKRR